MEKGAVHVAIPAFPMRMKIIFHDDRIPTQDTLLNAHSPIPKRKTCFMGSSTSFCKQCFSVLLKGDGQISHLRRTPKATIMFIFLSSILKAENSPSLGIGLFFFASKDYQQNPQNPCLRVWTERRRRKWLERKCRVLYQSVSAPGCSMFHLIC